MAKAAHQGVTHTRVLLVLGKGQVTRSPRKQAKAILSQLLHEGGICCGERLRANMIPHLPCMGT